jgi:hypothetical protein
MINSILSPKSGAEYAVQNVNALRSQFDAQCCAPSNIAEVDIIETYWQIGRHSFAVDPGSSFEKIQSSRLRAFA